MTAKTCSAGDSGSTCLLCRNGLRTTARARGRADAWAIQSGQISEHRTRILERMRGWLSKS